jgi:hypothetical protein
MKRRVLIIVALILVCWAFVISRPPRAWSSIAAGMSRQDVYARLGQPAILREQTKGFVFWERDLLVGRWEFSAAFHGDDTVGAFGRRWRWNW